MSSKKSLILNGNFSKGNKDFTTDYTYVAPNPQNTTMAGDYSVVSDPGMQVGGGFSSFGDHTGGGGQMLLLDGSTNQSNFWGQNVTLAANTSYSFTYFVTGADGEGAPPQIGLTVDGDQVDAGFRSSAYGGGAGWQQVTVSFTTIQAGTYALALHDVDTSPSGNNFAVDDISLSKVAPVPAGQNLLVNGDFEGPSQGFTSDYVRDTASSKTSTTPGHFSLISNPAKDWAPGFDSYGDHTSGAGHMLFVDGTGSGAFWREAVTLAANTTYSFTYFVTGADSRNLPNIALTLNGGVLEAGFQVSADGGANHWQEVIASFTTGASGSYVLAMSDNTGQPLGNDFTVDDLSLVFVGSTAARPESAAFHHLQIAPAHGLEVHHLAIA